MFDGWFYRKGFLQILELCPLPKSLVVDIVCKVAPQQNWSVARTLFTMDASVVWRWCRVKTGRFLWQIEGSGGVSVCKHGTVPFLTHMNDTPADIMEVCFVSRFQLKPQR